MFVVCVEKGTVSQILMPQRQILMVLMLVLKKRPTTHIYTSLILVHEHRFLSRDKKFMFLNRDIYVFE